MWRFVSSVLVVSTSVTDCLERLVSEMTYYASSGTLNPTHSLTHSHQTNWFQSQQFNNALHLNHRWLYFNFCHSIKLQYCIKAYEWKETVDKHNQRKTSKVDWACPHHVLHHDSLLGDMTEGSISSNRPSGRHRQKTLTWMTDKVSGRMY